jgi:hypothetical protein
MGFPFKCFAVWYWNTSSNRTNSRGFDFCHLKTSLTISLDAINCHNSYFHFFVSSTVDVPTLYEATATCQLLPLSRPLIISSYWNHQCYVSPLVSSTSLGINYQWQNFQSQITHIWSWGYFPQVPNCQDFWLISNHIKGILLYKGVKLFCNMKGRTRAEGVTGYCGRYSSLRGETNRGLEESS